MKEVINTISTCVYLLYRYFFFIIIADKSLKAFEDAVKKHGSLHTFMAQCIPFGPPGVGKTCLFNRLVDKPITGKPTTRDGAGSGLNSTIVLEGKRVQVAILGGSTIWQELEEQEEFTVFLDLVERFTSYTDRETSRRNNSITGNINKKDPEISSENEHAKDPRSDDLHQPPNEEHQVPNENLTNQPDSQLSVVTKANALSKSKDNVTTSPQSSIDDTRATDTPHVYDEMIEALKNRNKTKVQGLLNDSATIFYADTGGQPEFHEVLPALIAGPTIFIFTFSLFHGLHNKYTVTYRSSDSKSLTYESSFTVKEVFKQFLASITSYLDILSRDVAHPDSKSSIPPLSILVVGTHKDLVSSDIVSKIDEELRKIVEETLLYKKGCIEYMTSGHKRQLIIPVDNYNNVEDDSAKVREVVDRIIRRKTDMKSPYKIEFPVPWIALEWCLKRLPKSTVTYKECIELAKKCNVPEEELQDCLLFLHHKTGTIRYYGSVKELEDTIIIQPSVIFGAISGLIVSTFTNKNVDGYEIDVFEQYGLFNSKRVESIFNKNKNMSELSFDVFLTLLNHLNILGPVHDPDPKFSNYDYFLPCALVHASEALSSEDQLDPLLVLFQGGFVPKGVFSALLVYLLREKKWMIQHDNCEPRLYRNQVYFYTDSSGINCPISLKATAEYLVVHVESKQASSSSRHKICQILEIGISNVCKHLRYDDSFCTHQFGFYCDHPDCAGKGKHIAKVDSTKKNMKCNLTKRTYPVHKDREHWFVTKEPG